MVKYLGSQLYSDNICTVGDKREHNVITLQKTAVYTLYFVLKLQCIIHIHYAKLQMLLYKTTDNTANNYTELQKNHTHMQCT